MNPSRLRAPSSDGALLAIPPLQESGRALFENQSALSRWDYDFQGRSANWLRNHARSEISGLAREFMGQHGLAVPAQPATLDSPGEVSTPASWVLTGHQPELFHPGVWVKNFAAAAIARKSGGVSLNVIVDNDLPKADSIRVPAVEPDGIRRVGVRFDRWPVPEVPFEDLNIADEEVFASFPDRVRDVLGNVVADPIIDEFWPLAMARREEVANVGLRFALARHELEGRWGVENLEVPLSSMCQSDSFLWFLSHILAHLPRFQEIHNEALREYRITYGIRSRNHPVAALEMRDDWREAPFWIWRAENPRRQALLARQVGRNIQLRIAGEQEILLELPLTADREGCCAVELLKELPGRSIRLRTRALTTTLFCRFLLGDLFLHGIGGAKYDELGDSIAERFFSTKPPEFLTLSQTLWLGLPLDSATDRTADDARRSLRDADFNPERILPGPIPDAARAIIEEKQKLIAGPQETRRQRKQRWRQIRTLNESLQVFVGNRRESLRERQLVIEKGMASNRLATSREYAFVLHSRTKLMHAMNQLAGQVVR